MEELKNYSYRGARADVLLHEQYLKEFAHVWKRAYEEGVVLPESEDPDYASLESLLRHVLWWARDYMMWIGEMLNLPDPAIRPVPEAASVRTELDSYMNHLFHRWRMPLKDIPKERFYDKLYKSRWNVLYCIDNMLEHAVMHPIRHRFQLMELLKQQ